MDNSPQLVNPGIYTLLPCWPSGIRARHTCVSGDSFANFPSPAKQDQRLGAAPGIRADSRCSRRGGNRRTKRMVHCRLLAFCHYLAPWHCSNMPTARTHLCILFIVIAAIVLRLSGIHDSDRPSGREVQGPGVKFSQRASASGSGKSSRASGPQPCGGRRLAGSGPAGDNRRARGRNMFHVRLSENVAAAAKVGPEPTS